MSRSDETAASDYKCFNAQVMSDENFEVSWAGALEPDKIRLGSTDCRLGFLLPSTGEMYTARPLTPEGAAVNGVALMDQFIAVSTRNEIVVQSREPSVENFRPKTYVTERGSHGIVATTSGWFVAPVGIEGLLVFDPRLGDTNPISMVTDTPGEAYYYRTVNLGPTLQGDLLTIALRRGGFGRVTISESGILGPARFFNHPNLDVIDVCRWTNIVEPDHPGMAALGRDGSVHFLKDEIEERVRSISFKEFVGKGQRILASHGYLFLLFSHCLYILTDVPSCLYSRAKNPVELTGWSLSLEAVDITIAGDKLLVILHDDIVFIDIKHLSELAGVTEFTIPFVASQQTWSLAPPALFHAHV